VSGISRAPSPYLGPTYAGALCRLASLATTSRPPAPIAATRPPLLVARARARAMDTSGRSRVQQRRPIHGQRSSSPQPPPSPSSQPVSQSQSHPHHIQKAQNHQNHHAHQSSQKRQQQQQQQLALSQFVAGAVAGLVNVVVLSPLEVVKVRMQAQSLCPTTAVAGTRYTGLGHALRVMLRDEGWRSFYKGMNASLWAFIPNWAVYWYSYEALKRQLAAVARRKDTPGAPHVQHQHQERAAGPPEPAIVHVGAALGAGALTALATAPLWTLKSRLQTEIATAAARRAMHPQVTAHTRQRHASVAAGLRRIVAEEGFFALYKGLTPTLLGLGHVMLQFPVYENLKHRLSRGREENIRPPHILIASSVSKILASAVFYGHEVVRVRMQVDLRAHPGVSEPVRMAALARQIVRTEGVRGLYRGFGTNLVRTVPACMLTFTTYELAKQYVTVGGRGWANAKAKAQDPHDHNPQQTPLRWLGGRGSGKEEVKGTRDHESR
jgi:solute carrier family 25 (mitochondrial folate transporter), member 32